MEYWLAARKRIFTQEEMDEAGIVCIINMRDELTKVFSGLPHEALKQMIGPDEYIPERIFEDYGENDGQVITLSWILFKSLFDKERFMFSNRLYYKGPFNYKWN